MVTEESNLLPVCTGLGWRNSSWGTRQQKINERRIFHEAVTDRVGGVKEEPNVPLRHPWMLANTCNNTPHVYMHMIFKLIGQ